MQRSEVRGQEQPNSHTDGHGQARTNTDVFSEVRGQSAEVRRSRGGFRWGDASGGRRGLCGDGGAREGLGAPSPDGFGDFSTVWKSFWRFLPLRSQSLAGSSGKPDAIDLAFALRLRLELGTRLFHAMEKSFPQCGKFLGLEVCRMKVFPRYGKKFSTVWKIWVAVFAATGCAVGAGGAAGQGGALAADLSAEGGHGAAAIEYRRAGLGEVDAERAAGWFWWAAWEYAVDGQWERSDALLDRAEDVAPLALQVPVAWLRAENALRRREWGAAEFHFDSLRLKAEGGAGREGGAVGEAAARGRAVARLRAGDVTGAAAALAEGEGAGDLAGARAAVEGYAGGRDKRPWVGGVLGLVPGLGYVYSGEFANGARSLILNGLFIWGMVETAEREQWAAFSVLTFFEFTWYSGSIYGGVDAAHRYNQRRLDAAVSGVGGGRRLGPDVARVPVVVLGFEF